MSDDQNENESKVKSFFATKLPDTLMSSFQWLLIIEKSFEIGTFANISWWLVFVPFFVRLVFAVVWPTQEIKDIIDQEEKK